MKRITITLLVIIPIVAGSLFDYLSKLHIEKCIAEAEKKFESSSRFGGNAIVFLQG